MTSAAPDGPVLVVGAGLIGASVGMALERAGVKTYLHDVDRTAAHVASSRGAGSDDPAPEDVATWEKAIRKVRAGMMPPAGARRPDAAGTDLGMVRLHKWSTFVFGLSALGVLVIPLVSWLWLGGAVVGLGAVIAALPQPKRREVTRPLVEAPATVGD